MRRNLTVIAFLLVIMIGGGVLTAGVGFGVPIIIQSENPAASPFSATPGQATQLILLIGFILFNVVGAGVTLAVLLWFGSREVERAKRTPNRAELEAQESEALPEATS